MKIISEYKELQGQVYDTPEACREAEAAVDAKKAKDAEVANQKRLENKQYYDAVATARENLKRARNVLKDAEGEARAIDEEANKKIHALLCPARKGVREAEQQLAAAIAAFNKQVGPYRINLADVDANDVDAIVHHILKDLFG